MARLFFKCEAYVLCLVVLLPVVMGGCRQRESLADENAVYYWRTEWRLDSTEQAFLQRHDIHRVYCRYFDVVMRDGEPMPNATIAFRQTPPEGLNIVPTIFITEDCMHETHEGLAQKLVRRVLQMNETHDIKGVEEIQIDCDYTDRSRHFFYEFLQEVRSLTEHEGLRLSATIRLHQLAMAPPPVDYGVLMVYNTGDPRKFEQRNPVLDRRDVQPYVRYLDRYDLPLAAAYPVYCWQRTIYGVHVEHTVAAEEILAVKEMLERKRPDLANLVLTYHLDKDNIHRYKPEEYEAIYCH